jgi:hypothetical protein
MPFKETLRPPEENLVHTINVHFFWEPIIFGFVIWFGSFVIVIIALAMHAKKARG